MLAGRRAFQGPLLKISSISSRFRAQLLSHFPANVTPPRPPSPSSTAVIRTDTATSKIFFFLENQNSQLPAPTHQPYIDCNTHYATYLNKHLGNKSNCKVYDI